MDIGECVNPKCIFAVILSEFFKDYRKFVKIAIVVRIRESQSVARSENDQLRQNERISGRSFPAKRIIWNSSLLDGFYKMKILRKATQYSENCEQ